MLLGPGESVLGAAIVKEQLVVAAAWPDELTKVGIDAEVARWARAGRTASRKRRLRTKYRIVNSQQRPIDRFLKSYVSARDLDAVISLE